MMIMMMIYMTAEILNHIQATVHFQKNFFLLVLHMVQYFSSHVYIIITIILDYKMDFYIALRIKWIFIEVVTTPKNKMQNYLMIY